MSIDQQLREAIRKSGKSALSIAKATGVPHPTITRFLAGADLRISRAAKLAAYFGMRLTTPKQPK